MAKETGFDINKVEDLLPSQNSIDEAKKRTREETRRKEEEEKAAARSAPSDSEGESVPISVVGAPKPEETTAGSTAPEPEPATSTVEPTVVAKPTTEPAAAPGSTEPPPPDEPPPPPIEQPPTTEQPRPTESTSTDEQLQKAAEILKKGPKNYEDIIFVTQTLSEKDYRHVKMEQKYGKGWWGSIKRLMAGDYLKGEEIKIEIEKLGINWQWNPKEWQKESVRKVCTTLFNKKNAWAAGGFIVAGALTGGLGAAGWGALVGSIGGRGMVEAAESLYGKDGKIRTAVAEAESNRWMQLRDLAAEYQKNNDPELLSKITEIYFKQGEHAVSTALANRDKELLSHEQKWTKYKNWGSLLGGIAGAGVGEFLAGQAAEKLTLLDIDGKDGYHHVKYLNDKWLFQYNSAHEAQAAVDTGNTILVDPGTGQAFHELGAGMKDILWAQFRNFRPDIIQVGTVLSAGLWNGIKEQQTLKQEQEKIGKPEQVETDQFRVVKEYVPQPETPQEKWQDYAYEQKLGKLPKEGEIWSRLNEKKDGLEREVTVKEIDWSKEPPRVIFNDQWEWSLDMKEFLEQFRKGRVGGGATEKEKEEGEPKDTGEKLEDKGKETTPLEFKEGQKIKVDYRGKLLNNWHIREIINDKKISVYGDAEDNGKTERKEIFVSTEDLRKWNKTRKGKK